MTTSTLTRPDVVPTEAEVRPLPARFVAPRRFDVHQIAHFERWVAARGDAERVEIDLGDTHFLDLAALGAVERSAERFGARFVVARTSPAVVLTLELAEMLRSGEQLDRAA